METVHAGRVQEAQHDQLQRLIKDKELVDDIAKFSEDHVASALVYHPMELVHLPRELKQRILEDADIMAWLWEEGFAENAIPRLCVGEAGFELNLSWSEADDHMLHALGRQHAITKLDLSGCQNITDDGLYELAENSPNLTHLDLRDCENVTRKGVNELRDLGLTVEW